MGYVDRVQQASRRVKASTQNSGFHGVNAGEVRDDIRDDLSDPLQQVGDGDITRGERTELGMSAATDKIITLLKVGLGDGKDLKKAAAAAAAAGAQAASAGNTDAKAACDLLAAWLLDLQGMAPVSSKGLTGKVGQANRRGLSANVKRLGFALFGGTNVEPVGKAQISKAWDASFDAASIQLQSEESADFVLSGWSGIDQIPEIYAAFDKAKVPMTSQNLHALAKQWLLRDVGRKVAAGNALVEGASSAMHGHISDGKQSLANTPRGMMRSAPLAAAAPMFELTLDKLADQIASGDLKGAKATASVLKTSVKHRGDDNLTTAAKAISDALAKGDAAAAGGLVTRFATLLPKS